MNKTLYGLGSAVSGAFNKLGNALPTTVRGNYPGNWRSPFGLTSSEYVSPWHWAAPYGGVGLGAMGTEFLGAKIRDVLNTHDNKK
jgi:hypothetical protein